MIGFFKKGVLIAAVMNTTRAILVRPVCSYAAKALHVLVLFNCTSQGLSLSFCSSFFNPSISEVFLVLFFCLLTLGTPAKFPSVVMRKSIWCY